jgi:hypothetical protein
LSSKHWHSHQSTRESFREEALTIIPMRKTHALQFPPLASIAHTNHHLEARVTNDVPMSTTERVGPARRFVFHTQWHLPGTLNRRRKPGMFGMLNRNQWTTIATQSDPDAAAEE